MKKSGLFFILFLLTLCLHAQTPKADSLMNIIHRESDDSVRMEARLQYFAEVNYSYSYMTAELFKGLEEAKELHDFYFLAEYNYALAVMYSQVGKNDSALVGFQTALSYGTFIKDTSTISGANLGLSNTYRNMGNFKLAFKYGQDAEKISLASQDFSHLNRVYNALGLIFKLQKEYEKAREYYRKGLASAKETNDSAILSGLYSNIATTFQEENNIDSSLFYHRKALDLRTELNDLMGLGITYGNFGLIFFGEGNLDSAHFYLDLALKKFEESNYVGGVMNCHFALGRIALSQDKNKEALERFKKAEAYAEAGNFFPDLVSISLHIARAQDNLGNYKEATFYFKQYIEFSDSLEVLQEAKEIQKLQLEYEYREKHLADSLKVVEHEKLNALETEKQRQITEEQAARFRTYTWAGIAVFALVLAVVIILYRSNKKQKESNAIIAEQKATVEEKNKEITDSITYAKRIQEAILPPASLVQRYLPESFILYLPKDIVAGDFYWFNANDKSISMAACDCTGHGVPGAMVSVVCANALNRTVKEFGIQNPGKILDKTRELVIETFEKSEKDVKDGMDIALIVLDHPDADGNRSLHFSGANNPLWIHRKGSLEMEEIKGDSQPIGKHAVQNPFSSHEKTVSKGDTLYFFTDGFQDQFGGEKGKKFKASAMQKLFLSVAEKSMTEQKKAIEKAFLDWKRNFEQLDDVCVIGVRI